MLAEISMRKESSSPLFQSLKTALMSSWFMPRASFGREGKNVFVIRSERFCDQIW